MHDEDGTGRGDAHRTEVTRVRVEPELGATDFEPFEALLRRTEADGATLVGVGSRWAPQLRPHDLVLLSPVVDGDGHAGATVARIVGVDGGMSDRLRVELSGMRSRRETRRDVRHRAAPTTVGLTIAGRDLEVLLVDVSVGGARLAGVDATAEPGDTAALRAAGVTLAGTVAWVAASRIGLRFDDGQRVAAVRFVRSVRADARPTVDGPRASGDAADA